VCVAICYMVLRNKCVFERKVPCQNVVILNIKFVLELVYAKE
jgi:hypothetical protein